MDQDFDRRKRRLKFRAWHRGTKEADLMIGGFVDRRYTSLTPEELDWFERLVEENDVDIMAWVTGSRPCPADFDGALMMAMQRLDYIPGVR
jgi:antitoxin CptB